jgi:hypothetical protein
MTEIMKRITDRRASLVTANALLLWLLLFSCAAHASAQSIKLDQDWQFFADKAGTALKPASLPTDSSAWRSARVGLSWNAQFADLRDYMGVAWYRTRFAAPQVKPDGHVLLRFGAVDYYCEVFVNGQQVGAHEGGYTPFDFDITGRIKPGANELLVRVVDPPMDEKENAARFPDMLYKEIPHGKQNWYVQTGGIWQGVSLEVKPKLYLKAVHVTAKIDGSLSVSVSTNEMLPIGIRIADASPGQSGPTSNAHRANQTTLDLDVRAIDPSGKAFKLSQVRGNDNEITFVGHIPNPKLWDTSQPNLYTIEASLPGDRYTDRFGFRSFEARGNKFYLNGVPFYMIAALDQDFYPETIYTPPSEEYVREMMLKGKRLGLNLLRCHIKVPDPVYLKVADEVGMLVWYEIPSWNDFNHFSEKAAARGEKIFAEQVQRDWNHPSIIIQSIINESWGADLKQQAQRQWLRAAFERAKRLTAPLGRLIVDNSACCDNFHVRTDIEDNHRYNSIPDDRAAFDAWVADFATHPKWNFSPHGDAERTGQEPLVLSEFGNWGLPKLPRDLPWWFGRDFASREVTRPAGLFERFKEFGFGSLFKDYNALAEETQWHQFASLKHEIEEIRSRGSIQGYVITEFTDINWEVNGLMDMWRNPKVYAAELARIQQPDVILARPQKVNYTSGERVEMPAMLSHYSARELSGARLQWSTDSGASGGFPITGPVTRASVAALPSISFAAPQVNAARRLKLLLKVSGRDGSLIAENSYDLFIFPKPAPEIHTALMVYAPGEDSAEPTLMKSLRAAGYTVLQFDPNNKFGLLITTVIDRRVQLYLQKGGLTILLAGTKEALPADSVFKVTPRAGSDLDGNWVTNFNWIRAGEQPFKTVAFNKVAGFESEASIPRFIIQGVRGTDYVDVMSGIFYGWLNNNAALAMGMRAGEAKIFATTYRFDAYGRDPYATHLLDAIIRYTRGQNFAPQTGLMKR